MPISLCSKKRQFWSLRRLFPILCKHIYHHLAGNGSQALVHTVSPGARSALPSCTDPPATLSQPAGGPGDVKALL